MHAGHNTRVHRLFLVIFLINARGTQHKGPHNYTRQHKGPQAVPGYISDSGHNTRVHRLFLVIFLISARGTQHKGPQAVPGYISDQCTGCSWLYNTRVHTFLVIFLIIARGTQHKGVPADISDQHNTRVHRRFLVIFLISASGIQHKGPQAVPGYISDQCTRDTTQGSTGCSWLYF